MTKDNPLGYEPLPQLLKKFAVPSIIAMLVSSLYNIVEDVYKRQPGFAGNRTARCLRTSMFPRRLIWM